MHPFGFLAVRTHTHTHKMCINFMDKNSKLHRKLSKERQRERERKRENDAAAAEKTKIIQKLKLEELKWGVVCCCCCCVGQLNLPRFFFLHSYAA